MLVMLLALSIYHNSIKKHTNVHVYTYMKCALESVKDHSSSRIPSISAALMMRSGLSMRSLDMQRNILHILYMGQKSPVEYNYR
jgi:hypothetical protein